MKLEQAIDLIEGCAKRMDALYKSTVFDEWTIVSLLDRKGKVLAYLGPRKEHFQKNFAADMEALRSELFSFKRGFGEFEFARHAGGTHFDAFMVLGEGLFLICNHTDRSINAITRDPHWLSAQVAFVELSDQFRSDPLVYPL